MTEQSKAKTDDAPFDGIVDNKIEGMPKIATVLFAGLIIWGVLFMAYFLFTGYSRPAEFEEEMKAHQASLPAATAPTTPPSATSTTTTSTSS